jgi:hypothetical protein
MGRMPAANADFTDWGLIDQIDHIFTLTTFSNFPCAFSSSSSSPFSSPLLAAEKAAAQKRPTPARFLKKTPRKKPGKIEPAHEPAPILDPFRLVVLLRGFGRAVMQQEERL